MHYIKCDHCGHFNKVKSEYLTFCTSCNKKLNVNFNDWKKRNPNRSFDDFKAEACLNEIPVEEKPKKKRTFKGSFFFGMLVGALIVIGFYSVKDIEFESTPAFAKFFSDLQDQTKDFEDKDWKRTPYGSYGLSIESPYVLTKGKIELPEAVMAYIDKMEIYELQSLQKFKVFISNIKYLDGMEGLNMDGAAHGSVNEMKAQPGVTDFQYNQEYIQNGTIKGFKQVGSFNALGTEIEFINTGFLEGINFWQILVTYEKGDENAKKNAERIINSTKIDFPLKR